jgi:hypothetical protein
VRAGGKIEQRDLTCLLMAALALDILKTARERRALEKKGRVLASEAIGRRGTTMKKDLEHLEDGVVLFRSMLLDAIDRGTPVRETAAAVAEQFIDLVDFDPEIDQWAMRVLIELSKDPEPVGAYARSVKDPIRKDILS